jgi:hypothetical protein
MKQKDSLNRKLKAYSSLAVGVLAMGSAAEAQILYTDTAATFDTNQTGFSFDLNHDGTTDFTFFLLRYNTGSQINYQVLGFGSNNVYEVAGELNTSNGYVYVNQFNEGETIGADLSWQPYHSLFWVFARHIESGSSMMENGHWLGASGKYAGLRLTLADQSYYGWIRLDVDSEAAGFSVDGFAMQSIPDSSVLAGDRDTLTSVQGIRAANHIHITSIGRHVIIENTYPGSSAMNIELLDIAGSVRYARTTQQKEIKLELPDWSPGIYLVMVTTDGVRATKKISIR